MAQGKRGYMSVLNDILVNVEGVRGQRVIPVVVLDLDHTLLNNGLRTISIIDAWRNQVDFKDQNLHVALRLVKTGHGLPYRLPDIVRTLGFDLERLPGLEDYWKKNFFCSKYIWADEPVPGSAKYCKALAERGATLVYLTGRHVPDMYRGTSNSLMRHGFPLLGTTRGHLIMKETFDIDDNEFKVRAYKFIKQLGRVVAAFDNEPLICLGQFNHFSGATIVRVGNICAKEMELPPQIHRINSFEQLA